MTDKRQALIDAIQAIQGARATYSSTPGQLPEGQMDIEVDPQLDEPNHNTTDDLQQQDVEVDDPDGILKQQKDEKEKRKKQKNDIKDLFDALNSTAQNVEDENERPDASKGKMDDVEQDEENDSELEDDEDDYDDEIDPDYRDAWNEIMQRFDTDNVTTDQIEQMIADIKSGALTSI